jgi:hypothetical protein
VKIAIDFRQHNELYPGSDLHGDEWEFVKAMANFQKATGRRYPSWREVLQVVKALGYRRSELPPPEIRP